MDSVLRQSKAMCPFMKKATAAGLRAMSTATPTAVSPCGGAMSKLQVLARRCPVMGKAMAVQSARVGHGAGFPSVAAKAGMSTFHGHAKTSKAKLHTSRPQEAQAVDGAVYTGREKVQLPPRLPTKHHASASPAATTRPAAPTARGGKFDYDGFYNCELEKKHKDKSYRYFNNINRLAKEFPRAHMSSKEEKVTVWCANDYLGMGRNPRVLKAMHETLDDKMPDCVILSDSLNHASMIQGIRHSGARKIIFKHNDVQDLEEKLASLPLHVPKIIAFESVYSMCGSIGPIEEICDLADKYGAFTFLDEVHAVGMATGGCSSCTRARRRKLFEERGISVISNPSYIVLISRRQRRARQAGQRQAPAGPRHLRAEHQLLDCPRRPGAPARHSSRSGYTREYCEELVNAIESIWNELGIKRTSDWASEGGFIGVGVPDAAPEEPLWTDEQLGIAEAARTLLQAAEAEQKTAPLTGGFTERLLAKEMKGLTSASVAA
ncbi:hypothetical protein CHGG_02875 [Chaetomium globosum CBS 148.51]|uniref:Aminotransferase class I/classII large domain-containing protein n=1 Tax=Chaetomium globosum (strain ATCC 6205 / CBS 148.51 / DSM 1962 / NBRC 6347 / NRRL 1970) TaxID=306901 RepID=Q2HA79_CHAGB|nr:uncharacterized protein CHGG_02875 [Chaetomium globosum CBS 148.51]EAQ90940.1 hypothetical protein CHGG_02875 [Chaetomium globosum CBS 148.51]